MANTNSIKKKSFLANTLEFIGLLLLVFLIRTFVFGLYQVPTGSMETTMLVGERFFAEKFTYLFRSPARGDIIAFNEPPAYYKYSDNWFGDLFQRYVWGPSNYTKRVIGIPGDRVRGVVENGKPVVYLNDVKLDEPYLNQYPLITVLKEDPAVLYKQIESELRGSFGGKVFDQTLVNRVVMQQLLNKTFPRSFDPQVPYDKQPFYRVVPDRIIRDEKGEIDLLYPATPIYPREGAEKHQQGASYWTGSDEFYIELGPDEYWLMGDNRMGSKDSRWFGPIKRKMIHGRILIRIWSIDSDESWWIVDLVKHPIDFFKRVRWNRWFQIVR